MNVQIRERRRINNGSGGEIKKLAHGPVSQVNLSRRGGEKEGRKNGRREACRT